MKFMQKPDTWDIQGLMDYAVHNMVQQGEQCKVHGQCLYHCNGKHCAVGWIMEAEGLPEDDEAWDVDEDVHMLIAELRGTNNVELLTTLQSNSEVLDLLQHFHDNNKKVHRQEDLQQLQEKGIDTSKEHWNTWVQMGTGDLEPNTTGDLK